MLLTHEGYKAIAAGLTCPATAFIDGHFRPATSGKTFDIEYGSAAAIVTSYIKHAIPGARALRAGTVTVNSFGEGDISNPFGFKQSGFGGRDNGIHAHDQYTQVKTIWVDLADDGDEAVD